MKEERTLVILKPDAIARGLISEILGRITRAGYRIIAIQSFNPQSIDPDMANSVQDKIRKHYGEIGQLGERVSEKVLADTISYMSSGLLIGVVFKGVNAIAGIRKLVGATEPAQAAPGTIRGDFLPSITYDYSHSELIWGWDTIPNLIHASSSRHDAREEISLWFGPDVFNNPVNTPEPAIKYIR